MTELELEGRGHTLVSRRVILGVEVFVLVSLYYRVVFYAAKQWEYDILMEGIEGSHCGSLLWYAGCCTCAYTKSVFHIQLDVSSETHLMRNSMYLKIHGIHSDAISKSMSAWKYRKPRT